MNVLDLFSGIGGFSLGLERAGMRTVAFCEIDPYCQAVLRKHWPNVPVYGDVRKLTAETLAVSNGVRQLQSQGRELDQRGRFGDSNIQVICGGFPCQDISVAGKGVGIEGERSGLWSEYVRIIREVRPHYVIVENVAALLGRGLERVLGDLAALGFDAEWHCIPASAIGAPHRRDRIWIVAYDAQTLSYPASAGWNGTRPERSATADGAGSFREPSRSDWWLVEPDVGRVAHGISARVDRLKALGNAIVPQIAEIIGRAINQSSSGRGYE